MAARNIETGLGVNSDVRIIENNVLLNPSNWWRALIFCEKCNGIIKYSWPSEILAAPSGEKVEM